MAKKKRPESRSAASPTANGPVTARGGGDGADVNDWIEAERELRTRRPR